MKRWWSVAACAVICAAFAVNHFSPRVFAEADPKQDVLAVVRQFQMAGIHGDSAALSQIFDPGVTHFHPGSPYRFVGAERLVNEFVTASRSQQDMHFEMLDPEVQFASDDTAIVTYYIDESWTDKNGAKSSVHEKATEVYVKKNGRWRMIHGHYSTS